MKIKLLLATIAGAALVACTQDDDFVIDKAPEAQSPITFTATFDNDLSTRATLNGAQVIFEGGDLISLYNGFNSAARVQSASDYGMGDYKGYTHNSIFEGTQIEGRLKFTSRAMVFPDGAVMVYPADTTFAWNSTKDDYLSVKIKSDQEKDYSKFVPQVTDFFKIDDYSGKIEDNNSAGYGRNYDVRFKALGSLLRLTMNAVGGEGLTAANLDPLKVKKVELINGTEKVFNTELILSILNAGSTLATDPDYAHFLNQTAFYYDDQLNPDGVYLAKSESLSTADIKTVDNKDVAHFVMLPNTYREAFSGSPLPVDDASSIKITTNYGTVTVSNDITGTKKPITRTLPNGDGPFTIKDGFANILGATWLENTTTGSKFNGAYGGASIQRTLEFDLTDLDMNNTKVRDSQELINFLTAYNTLGKTDATNVILEAAEKDADGEYTDTRTYKFDMTAEALEALDELGGGNVTVNHNSDTISINGGDMDTFGLLNDDNVKFSSNITLALNGTWELDQSADFKKVAKLVNQGDLTVTGESPASPFGVGQIYNQGTIAVDGVTYMYPVESVKGSVINIPTGSAYYATNTDAAGGANNHTILYGSVNIEAGGQLISYNEAFSGSRSIRNFGVINNYGMISSRANPAGEFHNGGTINNMSDDCIVYITRNTAADTRNSNYENTGEVVLKNRNDQVSVNNTTKQGYIKFAMNAGASGLIVDHEEKDKFNYLIIDVKVADAVVDISAMHDNVDYLEVTGLSAEFASSAAKDLDVLISNNTKIYYAVENASFAINSVWVKTLILHGGGFNITNENSPSTYNSNIYGALGVSYGGQVLTY